jgi:hypothetical protein
MDAKERANADTKGGGSSKGDGDDDNFDAERKKLQEQATSA